MTQPYYSARTTLLMLLTVPAGARLGRRRLGDAGGVSLSMCTHLELSSHLGVCMGGQVGGRQRCFHAKRC